MTTPTAQDLRLQALLAMPLIDFIDALWRTISSPPWTVSHTVVEGETRKLYIVERLGGSLVCTHTQKADLKYWNRYNIETREGTLTVSGINCHETVEDDSEAARREALRLLTQYGAIWYQRLPTGGYFDLSQVTAVYRGRAAVEFQVAEAAFTAVDTTNDIFMAYCLDELQRWVDTKRNPPVA